IQNTHTVRYPVAIEHSLFSDNAGNGLVITTGGTVTIKKVTAQKNGSFGAMIDGTAAFYPVQVDLSMFDFNAGGMLLQVNVDSRISCSYLRYNSLMFGLDTLSPSTITLDDDRIVGNMPMDTRINGGGVYNVIAGGCGTLAETPGY